MIETITTVLAIIIFTIMFCYLLKLHYELKNTVYKLKKEFINDSDINLKTFENINTAVCILKEKNIQTENDIAKLQQHSIDLTSTTIQYIENSESLIKNLTENKKK